ncbi:HD domain-containing phosphohydrolase [uncultured Azonexus sp.]|uniref:HD domain-containing phosphohydrolase n=1 Tax=uncultured Azonexus sp. TaxID=520307 RepID=UPI0026039932|nr:HD domain-containing phosphohydrolase [uncultured Azonexus sp.]
MKKNSVCEHQDLLNRLNEKLTMSEKIGFLHRVLRQRCEFVHRIGIAVYDPQDDMLQTFAHSTNGENPLGNYQCRLRDAKSLYRISLDGKPRVINDMSVFARSRKTHARKLNTHGYQASYTVPIYQNGQLGGFVFFNSRQAGVFDESSLPYLDMIARLVSLLVNMELKQVQVLLGALRTATCFSGHKDPETGAHLARMARFSRLIANAVARDYRLEDEFVEAVFWFAPMHDIGKIAIPDEILRKPGKLTEGEMAVMKTHTTKGREMIESMLGNFGLEEFGYTDLVCHIAECHHENYDGSGYPYGLIGEDIPIEARIVAVADVFDALTSKRSYKEAWSNEEAFDALRKMATWKLDPRCVEALIACREEIVEIQAAFRDEHEQAVKYVDSPVFSAFRFSCNLQPA